MDEDNCNVNSIDNSKDNFWEELLRKLQSSLANRNDSVSQRISEIEILKNRIYQLQREIEAIQTQQYNLWQYTKDSLAEGKKKEREKRNW